MRKHYSLLAIAVCFGLLSLFPATAQAAICSSVCTSTTSCSLSCTAIGGGEPEITTCGDWGVCAYPPPPPACTSNWVTTSTTQVGGFSQARFAPPGCDYYGAFRVVQHDTNSCKPDKVTCQHVLLASLGNTSCCTTYWCGGLTHC